MPGGFKVLACVTIRAVITTQNDTADAALSKMHPTIPCFDTLFADSAGFLGLGQPRYCDHIKMCAAHVRAPGFRYS